MDVENYFVFLIGVACQLVWQVKAKGYCNFPDYLSSPSSEGSRKIWIGRTEYKSSNSLWDVQEEIIVKETEIQVKAKSRSSCIRSKRHGSVVCYDHNIVHTIICLTEERHEKFRVQIMVNGERRFSCIKFLQRTENVVQVFKAEPSLLNEDKLCHDKFLLREDWPWLLPKLNTWKFCPDIGGYDFRSTDDRGKKVCDRDWLPSRLESECVDGDGMVFTFPEAKCGPFQDLRKEFQMQCWGHWTEGNDLFVLFGEPSVRLPRYSLKIPKDAQHYAADEFAAKLYLNAIVPGNNTDTPAWSLSLLRSGPGVCYDESEFCKNAKRLGQCTTHGQYEYAKLCRKACGLCDLAPTDSSECHFPMKLQGDWVLFTERGRQIISITDGELVFSNFGRYSCKSMHWENEFYKVISTYTNGCRPRYTCIKIARGTGDTLRVQFSRSSLNDKSFELCQFEDDIYPLGSYIHSRIPKQLIPMQSMFKTTCNLDGHVSVETRLLDGSVCDGRMSDVSEYTCQSLTKFTVRLMPPCTHPNSYAFECIASGQLEKASKFLITEYNDKEEAIHICWKIQAGTDIPTTYTRITCDSAETYTNKSYSYNIPVAAKEEGIASLSLKNDFESPCGKFQDDENYVHKQPSPWPPDETYNDYNNNNNNNYRDTNKNKANRSMSVIIDPLDRQNGPSEQYVDSSTVFTWPKQGPEANIFNSAASAIHINVISMKWLSIHIYMLISVISCFNMLFSLL